VCSAIIATSSFSCRWFSIFIHSAGIAALPCIKFNVGCLKRHSTAPLASMLVCVALAAKHQQVFWRIKLAPFAVSNMVRFDLCLASALLAQPTRSLLRCFNNSQENRML